MQNAECGLRNDPGIADGTVRPHSSCFPTFRNSIPALACVLVLTGLGWLYFPFTKYLLGGDVDAMAFVGEIRATGRFSSWSGGSYFISALIGAVTRLGAWRARPAIYDDYLASYQIVVLASALGIAALVYAMIYARTRSMPVAAAFSLLLGLAPGMVRLVAAFEDNLPASLMHMQLVAVYSGFVWLRREGAHRRSLRALAGAALPVSLALAVLAHRQLAVTLITPLGLYYFLRHESPRARIGAIARTYLICFILLAGAFAGFSRGLPGGLQWKNYGETLGYWFFPCEYYRGFYFFNQFGWNIGRQALEIMAGWGQLGGDVPMDAAVTAVLALGLGGLLFLGLRGSGAWLNDYDVILIAFILIHVPHSLIYESRSLERWDVILPPLAVLGGVWVRRAARSGEARCFGRTRGLAFPLVLVLLCLGAHCVDYYARLRVWSDLCDHDPRYGTFHAVRLLRDFHREHQPGKKVVVIFPDVPDKVVMIRWFMIAETMFNFRDAIFFIGEERGIEQPFQPYFALKPVSLEDFRRQVKGTVILANSVLGQKMLTLAPGEQTLLF